ncbi:uncharacterized protein [Heptranchias perlo]|uniref:uncharacterized protein n=1 Tax=Heptranchias perlo TaxID=212740 RepID=UPI00355AA2AF
MFSKQQHSNAQAWKIRSVNLGPCGIMLSEGTKAEAAEFNHRLRVSRDTFFISSASLRWWDMATPKQALLDRRFEVVGNGWVPVNTHLQSESSDRITAKNRCQTVIRPNRPLKLRISPIKLLFKGNVDLGKVCDWFMQTTETRSLTITKRSDSRNHPEDLNVNGLRSVRRQTKVQPRPRRQHLGKDLGKTATKLVGNSFPVNGAGGMKRKRIRHGVGGCNLRDPSRSNWSRRESVHRKHGKRQKATPTHGPQGQQPQDWEGGTNWANTKYQTDRGFFESPRVLSVKGTDYKLVPVGNRLPASEDMRGLNSTSVTQLESATRPQSGGGGGGGDSARRVPQGTLLTEAERKLGCLRDCRVVLRKIKRSRPPNPSQADSWSRGKSVKRRRRRWTPASKRRGHGPQVITAHENGGKTKRQTDTRVTESRRVLPVNRSESKDKPTPVKNRYVALPAFGNMPDVGPTSLAQLDNTVKSREREGSAIPVQQENLLTDKKWQLAGLKECRVVLRKIKALDVNHLNGFASCQPSKISFGHKQLDQGLENVEEKNSGEAEFHTNPYGTDSFMCEENQNKCLVTNNQDADISTFVKVQGFSSTNELESTMKPQESDMNKQLKDTFTDSKWKLGGLKECSVVLKKIAPLDGNHFISLTDGQLFRLGLNDIKDTNNRQEL